MSSSDYHFRHAAQWESLQLAQSLLRETHSSVGHGNHPLKELVVKEHKNSTGKE